jgi:hypothetical protein
MCQLVDNDRVWMPFEEAGEIELVEVAIPVKDLSWRHNDESVQLLDERRSTVSLDKTNDDLHPSIGQPASLLQAGEGLAHAWGSTEEDVQPAASRLGHDRILPSASPTRLCPLLPAVGASAADNA